MKNKLTQLFNSKKNNILSIYFTASYPTINDTTTIINHLDKAGVDLIEIGIPFSDPLADGPIIQASCQQALDNGMTLKLLLNQLKDIRQSTQIPIVLMGYLNTVLAYGIEAFYNECAKIGIDGVILPDLPLDYYQSKFEALSKKHNISNIMLISNETPAERISTIDKNTNGFLYMVSSNSITGANKDLNTQTDYYQRIKDMQLTNPLLIGFGIYDHTTYELTCQYSSGAIIGTAFIKHINENGISQESISNFVNGIRGIETTISN
ncbi:tryptophan synthase subunit alpha [Myroides injenensis]|uniref:tryptophan synthase subunit alpha n=1 Tax=Myroides injenensis TaxID=1183151 RepID=UPI000287EDDE|nr:tryptophan synthase subunit alpha [Myroides injenensis]